MAGRTWFLVILLAAGLIPSATRARPQVVTSSASFEVFADGFRDIRGIAVDDEGNVFVADREAGTVTRIGRDSTRVLVASGLERPVGLAFDATGHLLIAEERAGRVVRVENRKRRTPLVSGVIRPRWLAVGGDGTLYIAARGGFGDEAPEIDEDSPELDLILSVTAGGQPSMFARGFRRLQGLATDAHSVYAATEGLPSAERVEGAVFQIPILAGGTAGEPVKLHYNRLKKPTGLVRDRLDALYVTTHDPVEDRSRRGDRAGGGMAKLHADGRLTMFAADLEDAQGLAFDPSGDLYVGDGTSGRVLRFRAPAPPTLVRPPAFTNEGVFTLAGTTEPNARVDVRVNEAPTPIRLLANSRGAFTVPVPLAPNISTALEVFATGHAGHHLTSPPASAGILHDGVAPSLVIQAPSAPVRHIVTLRAQASDSGSYVAAMTLAMSGPLLSALLEPRPPAPSVTASATWDTRGAPDGAHSITASATDRAGNRASITRAVIVDNTAPETRITDAPPGDPGATSVTFSFTGKDNLTPASKLQFAWRLDGGVWSSFSPMPSATFSNLAQGAHRFEVKARDQAGNEDPTPDSRSFNVGGLRLMITLPSNGATVPAGLLLVHGTVDGGGIEAGLTINGLPARVQGTSFAALVPITEADSSLTAVATTALGAVGSHTIGISVQAGLPIAIVTTPASGIAPLTVSFSLATAVAVATLSADFDGNGVTDFNGDGLDGQPFTYGQPGLYFPTVTIVDGHGNARTATAIVQVYDLTGLDGRLQATWAGFKARLRGADVEGALGFISSPQRDSYRELLNALTVPFSSIDVVLRDITFVSLVEDRAEYQMIRVDQGIRLSYFVSFVRDRDGLWRLDFF